MAFRIQAANGISGKDALDAFSKACKFLEKSNLAKEIISDLRDHNKIITIKVGPGLVDKYRHPTQPTDSAFVGTVEWDPGYALNVVDKVKSRPKQPWVPNKKESKPFWACCGTRAPINHYGTIPPEVCLMHELGHVLQYLSNPDEFRGLFRKPDGMENVMGKMEVEDINTAAVEQPVILELRAAGVNMGIRWDYYHTAD